MNKNNVLNVQMLSWNVENFLVSIMAAIILKNSGAVYWGIDKHIINLHAKHNSKSFSL